MKSYAHKSMLIYFHKSKKLCALVYAVLDEHDNNYRNSEENLQNMNVLNPPQKVQMTEKVCL